MTRLITAIMCRVLAIGLLTTPALADEKSFEVSGFTNIDTSVGVNVDVSVGSDFSVRATGSEKDLERLKVAAKDDTLYISRKLKKGWGRSASVRVAVTLPKLEALEASSGSSIDADGIIADGFSIDASTGATISAEGSCTEVKIDVSSGASINAGDLKCIAVLADGSSGGSISAAASAKVIADMSSGASIRVYGSPEYKEIEKSSGGSVSIEN